MSSMTSPLDINIAFELNSVLVAPGTVLAEDEVEDLIVEAYLEARGTALWLYPYGDLVTEADSDFYNHIGVTQIELPAGVVCTSESGVFLTEAGQDTDGDGLSASNDNCTDMFNPDQRDTNSDGFGNECDPDLTNDCLVNFGDLALLKGAFFPNFSEDADLNGDGSVNFGDLARMKESFFNGSSPGPGPSGVPNACDDD